MKRFILIAFLFLFFIKTAHAEVSQFVFVSPPQKIEVGATSTLITIQSEDASGLEENIAETIDVVFTSTSGTGKFLSTTGKAVSTTMSKGTSNKNFLYQDTSNGSYTITIQATGRTSLKTFSATQGIVVGTGGTNPPTSNGDENNDSDSTNSSNTGSGGAVADVSTSKAGVSFAVAIGKDKLASVGSEINFKATPSKVSGIPSSYIAYDWSFGDGSTAKGQTVSHYYRFPGEYLVVLNSSAVDYSVSTRLNVKVGVPTISVSRIEGGVEITNKSNMEMNLEDWKLVGGTKTFIFPLNTLISVGKKVIFADDITGVNSDKVELLSPQNKIFGSGILESVQKEQFALDNIQTKIAEIKNNIGSLGSTTPKIAKVKNPIKPEVVAVATTSTTTANTATVFIATKKAGFVSGVVSISIKGFNFIKHLFVEN